MPLRHLPKFKSSRHLADEFLNFNDSQSLKAPHLIGQLTTDELISMSVRGTLTKTCKKLLTKMYCSNATSLVIDMLVSGQHPDVVAPLTERRPFEAVARDKGYELVGSGNTFSFLCWNEPSTILINQDGSSQINWEMLCTDIGLPLNDFSWNISDSEFSPTLDAMNSDKDYDFSPPIQSFAQYSAERIPDASVLMTALAKLLNGNKVCQSAESQEYAINACAWLMDASYPRGHTQQLLGAYLNHDFLPEHSGNLYSSASEAAQAACEHFIERHINHSRDPAITKMQLDWMQAPHRFNQFLRVESTLADQLSLYGEQTMLASDTYIWCVKETAPAETLPVLTQVLINHYPQLLDEAIRDFHPEASNRIARESNRLQRLGSMEGQAIELATPDLNQFSLSR